MLIDFERIHIARSLSCGSSTCRNAFQIANTKIYLNVKQFCGKFIKGWQTNFIFYSSATSFYFVWHHRWISAFAMLIAFKLIPYFPGKTIRCYGFYYHIKIFRKIQMHRSREGNKNWFFLFVYYDEQHSSRTGNEAGIYYFQQKRSISKSFPFFFWCQTRQTRARNEKQWNTP